MTVKDLPQRAALAAIRLYQITLSPYLGRQCRFYPSCSHYAAEAIERHGVARGSALAAARLVRCHPFHPGGVDLVPTVDAPDIDDLADRHAPPVARLPVDRASRRRCVHQES